MINKTDSIDFSRSNPHSFHIPVMGTGFSIDTAIKVARYGISSVLSLVDDVLIEQLRKYHSQEQGLDFTPIAGNEKDSRARRITAYLDMLHLTIQSQLKSLRSSPFDEGSEITRYFELLPDSDIKQAYHTMLKTTKAETKRQLQDELRHQVTAGSIDVNIMTKLDREYYLKGEVQPKETSDAMTALRGFAESSIEASIVFSAGLNRKLYGYLAEFKDFFPNDSGAFKKQIILKVTDYRSAMIQGKFLAMRGLWVSEFRVESGLNCGGHAFGSDGTLMGSILEEFKLQKMELIDKLHKLYNKALAKQQRQELATAPPIRLTVQGGIGTYDEDRLLLDYYEVDGTGWGTPFLLVPEVTNVDDVHLTKLMAAGDEEIELSRCSPIGVPFWSLKTSTSEETRNARIEAGKPGSKCPKGFLVSNSEFTSVPICHASRTYQKRKIDQLTKEIAIQEKLTKAISLITDRACICHDLAGGATLKYGIAAEAETSVCCGPNISNFAKTSSLEEIVGHIYGRLSVMTNPERPHMFIRELSLYVDNLRSEVQTVSEELLDRSSKRLEEYKRNMIKGIEHYRSIAEKLSSSQQAKFLQQLDEIFEEIQLILPETGAPLSVEGAR